MQPCKIESPVIRLGEVAIATNDVGVFTDFGIQIKGRSAAIQAFVVQPAGPGAYTSSQRAVDGDGYGTTIQSSVVQSEDDQELVDRTVEQTKSLWDVDEAENSHCREPVKSGTQSTACARPSTDVST